MARYDFGSPRLHVDQPLQAAVDHWRRAWTDHATARIDATTVSATHAATGEMRAVTDAMAGLARA